MPERLETIVFNALEKRLTRYEREVINNYAAALRSIRADIGKVYEKYAVNGILTNAEMTRYNRLKALEKQIVSDIGPALNGNQATIDKVPRVEYEEAFFRYAWATDNRVGAALNWGALNNDTVLAAVANPLADIAKDKLRKDSVLKIRRAVAQGLAQGSSYPNMMKGVKDAINGSASDAVRIVRTEGQRAQVLGQQETYARAEDIGVDMVQVWDAALDSRTRPEHGRLDGKEAEVDEIGPYWKTSVTTSGKVRGPLQFGDPAQDIHCRCRIRGQIKGFEPKQRRVAGKITKYITYEDWKNGMRKTA